MKLTEQFLAFELAHPEVWDLFVQFTCELIGKGKKHGSADAVLHRIRWNYEVSADEGAPKLNNNFSACYARKFHRQYPAHDGFFLTRKSQADPQPNPQIVEKEEA